MSDTNDIYRDTFELSSVSLMSHISEHNRCVNSKWQMLGGANTELSVWYVYVGHRCGFSLQIPDFWVVRDYIVT